MRRTTQRRKPKPLPGAAKFVVDLDEEMGLQSKQLAQHLIKQFLAGNPTAMNIVAAWAQDAEFARQCETVHGKTLSQILEEIEAEQAKAATSVPENTGSAQPALGESSLCSTLAEPVAG